MISSEITLKKYTDIKIDLHETLRYMGCDGQRGEVTGELYELADSCLNELEPLLDCSVLSCTYPVKLYGDFCIKLGLDNGRITEKYDGAEDSWRGYGRINSKNLYKNLDECDYVVLFAATVGFECDRLLAKYKKILPSRAIGIQAAGTAAIEELCDTFCKEKANELEKVHMMTKPRFSPGYGDFDIAFQKDIFTALECNKRTGITLKENFLMIPSKSVTAVMGIYGR